MVRIVSQRGLYVGCTFFWDFDLWTNGNNRILRRVGFVISKPLSLLQIFGSKRVFMSIVLRLENLDCRKICQEIERYIKIKKPDPNKTYLVIGLSDIVESSDNHILKLEYKN